jgi:hypothetical protein
VDWTQASSFERLGLGAGVDEIELTEVADEIEEVQRLFA